MSSEYPQSFSKFEGKDKAFKDKDSKDCAARRTLKRTFVNLVVPSWSECDEYDDLFNVGEDVIDFKKSAGIWYNCYGKNKFWDRRLVLWLRAQSGSYLQFYDRNGNLVTRNGMPLKEAAVCTLEVVLRNQAKYSIGFLLQPVYKKNEVECISEASSWVVIAFFRFPKCDRDTFISRIENCVTDESEIMRLLLDNPGRRKGKAKKEKKVKTKKEFKTFSDFHQKTDDIQTQSCSDDDGNESVDEDNTSITSDKTSPTTTTKTFDELVKEKDAMSSYQWSGFKKEIDCDDDDDDMKDTIIPADGLYPIQSSCAMDCDDGGMVDCFGMQAPSFCENAHVELNTAASAFESAPVTAAAAAPASASAYTYDDDMNDYFVTKQPSFYDNQPPEMSSSPFSDTPFIPPPKSPSLCSVGGEGPHLSFRPFGEIDGNYNPYKDFSTRCDSAFSFDFNNRGFSFRSERGR